MNPLIYDDIKPTRDALQDIAKILGKVQQAFIEPAPHDWHKGLEINASGLQTQELVSGQRIKYDFANNQLVLPTSTLQLAGINVSRLFEMLANWAGQNGAQRPVDRPEFYEAAQFDSVHAAAILASFVFTADMFKDFSGSIATGTLSPLLLYPHHFDASLVWFPKKNDEQLGFGFSTGDDDVQEAYFYVTQYPETEAFKHINLFAPARWQTVGFSGAILPYNDIVLAADSRSPLLEFLRSLLSAAQS